MARRFRKKHVERAIARRRIERLFAVAHRRVLEGEPVLAERSVGLARRIAMRYQTGLEAHERDAVCRACGQFLSSGRTARIRFGGGMKRTTCLRCGNIQRRPYRAEQKAARRLRAAARRGERPVPVVVQVATRKDDA